MRAVILRSFLVIGVGGLVLAGLLYVASTVDARPPEVLEITLTQPVADDGSEEGLITTSIEVSFSEPVDPDSAVGAVALDPPVDGSATWSGSTLIFTPAEPLELATEYTVTLAAGIRDMAGNEMEEPPPPFAFATTGRPSLAETDPVDGAMGVPVDAVIGLVFSRLMDTASVEGALEISPRFAHELRWSGERLEILPDGALEPGTDYTVRVGREATDVAGVEIAEEVTFEFRTVASGLRVEAVIPADGTDGIAPRTAITLVFDRAVDPDSVDAELLTMTPEVAGTLEVVAEPQDDAAAGRLLRFTPSAPLPPNTTVELELAAGLFAADGGRLAEPVAWSFTTGAPQSTVSNQILFLSDRSGVANVWAMNPDGTGQRQVSAESSPVLDYAVAPNGGSLVVADGRRLVFLRADGAGRQVLTDDSHLEFDPVYAPDGLRIAFARADAETGTGLGLWTWEIGAGSATELELPQPSVGGPSPWPDPDGGAGVALRAPRYSPDGGALAFVDVAGSLGILELPGHRLTLVEAAVATAPAWDARSSALLLRLRPDDAAPVATFMAPVDPLDAGEPTEAGIVRRSGTRLEQAAPAQPVRRFVAGPDGRIGWIDADGVAHLAAGLEDEAETPEPLVDVVVAELVFGPTPGIVLVVVDVAGDGAVERIDLESGERTRLMDEGRRVRWLP